MIRAMMQPAGMKPMLRFVPAFLFLAATAQPQVQQARRIAVYSFQDIASSGQQQVGQKLYDRLLSRLIDSGAYQVFDRQFLERVMAEQGVQVGAGNAGRAPAPRMPPRPPGAFDSATAVQAGKFANVAAIVEGTITTFTYNQHSSEDAIGWYGTVTVAATARLISTETGAMLTAPSVTQAARGMVGLKTQPTPQPSCRQRFGVGYICTTPQAPAPPSVDTKTMEQLLDEGIEACARSLAQDLADAGPLVGNSSYLNAPATPPMASPATVIGVSEGMTYVNRGKNAGLKVGLVLQVSRLSPSGLTDPGTGRPITKKSLVCTLSLGAVEPGSSSGICTGGIPANGDIAEVRLQ
jgi:hypothetical protein